ncbi:hypothetical protein M405DRAFT_466919 [Rhizopogon salebrosus TDB-379]|nr:hypothetical protein M405DRAFT_466919 [Rhizopogon salebrosus TDB-379]
MSFKFHDSRIAMVRTTYMRTRFLSPATGHRLSVCHAWIVCPIVHPLFYLVVGVSCICLFRPCK